MLSSLWFTLSLFFYCGMRELHRVGKLAREPFPFETEIASGLSVTYELQLEFWQGLSFEG